MGVSKMMIAKVKAIDTNSLSEIMLSRNPFGIASYERGFDKPIEDGYVLHSSKGIGYVTIKTVSQNLDYADSFKVMISKVTCEHAGEPDKDGMMKVLSSTKVLKPQEVCTDSYLILGNFDNEIEAKNLCSFLKTRFARFLLLQAVSSINLSKDKFCFVPLLNFNEEWPDSKLYAKYGLTEEEIAFIESMIRPME